MPKTDELMVEAPLGVLELEAAAPPEEAVLEVDRAELPEEARELDMLRPDEVALDEAAVDAASEAMPLEMVEVVWQLEVAGSE